ncbi:MAG: D-2-hydroxyacid dehydrogenase [Myxococcales bacterium]|nr:D-2-hydroxyacid dehydrogenase [Myxococcales bacterium]
MTATKLVVWCNQSLGEEASGRLRSLLATHRLHWAPDGQTDPALLREADVAFGQPPVDALMGPHRLRLVQLTSAGYTTYDRQDLKASLAARGVVMTKASWVYDEPCADHVLAFMLAAARALPAAFCEQKGPRGWPTAPLRSRSFLLRDREVLLVGFGSIGRRLVERLAAFGARVKAARRQPTGHEPVPTTAIGEPTFARWLAQAEHVVNLLPANASTLGFFDTGRFAAMKPGAHFYNVGRGSTVETAALGQALQSGHLAAAYLDVTEPEPLPAGHALWTAPNCFITPHTAGGHDDEDLRLVELLRLNIERIQNRQTVIDQVT